MVNSWTSFVFIFLSSYGRRRRGTPVFLFQAADVVDEHGVAGPITSLDKETFLLTTYWSESSLSSR